MRRWAFVLLGLGLACGDGTRDSPDATFRIDGGQASPDSGMIINTTIQVQRVLDGDTVELSAGASVMTPDGRSMSGAHVRLLAIDAPEIAHPEANPPTPADCWGNEAQAAARALMGGRVITLQFDLRAIAGCTPPIQRTDAERCGLRDIYDRLLAYVVLPDGTVANQTMVREGNAYSYRHEVALYNQLEDEARAAMRGMWGVCP